MNLETLLFTRKHFYQLGNIINVSKFVVMLLCRWLWFQIESDVSKWKVMCSSEKWCFQVYNVSKLTITWWRHYNDVTKMTFFIVWKVQLLKAWSFFSIMIGLMIWVYSIYEGSVEIFNFQIHNFRNFHNFEIWNFYI